VSDSGAHKKISNGLVALSSAAVLAVYTAGYVRTKSAADRFALLADARRPAIPAPATSAPPPTPSTVTISAPPAETASALPAKQAESTPLSTVPASSERPRRAATGKTSRRVAATPVNVESEVARPLTPPVAVAELPAAVIEQTTAATAPTPPEPPKRQYRDGTYFGWGTSRHGDIQAQVIIQDGRILSATIAQCLTRYSCSVIAKLPPQVAERQSPETDYVSGATQSTNAFYYGVVEALSKAK
jgi:uncharacterized protein with FMN-binding domain